MIQARHLSKRYGSKLAVDDLSFEVRPGIVTGFLGPNGAGKSTTMRLMLGLDNGQGDALFDGVPYRKLKYPMREVGALLEVKAFHPTRRARDHLRMLAASHRIGRQRADEVLEWVGLQSVARKRPKGYSMGMAQRLGLAAALLGDPQTLILDEPANGLDPAGINWLRMFLKSFAAEGRTVFVSSHLLAEMALMADHLVVIGQGRLIVDEPTGEFVRRSSRGAVIVRTPHVGRLAQVLDKEGAKIQREEPNVLSVSGLDRADIGELAFRHGIVLHELATRTATLEDAFLEATGASAEFRADPRGPAGATNGRGASAGAVAVTAAQSTAQSTVEPTAVRPAGSERGGQR